MKHWTRIEKFVKTFLVSSGMKTILELKQTLTNRLGRGVPLHEDFKILADSKITDAGHYGYESEKNQNDCLIHSLFSCLSRTFRSLEDNRDRNEIASFFRRCVLPFWLKQKYLDYDVDYEKELRSTSFLEQSLGSALCKKLGVNILWVTKPIPSEDYGYQKMAEYAEYNPLYDDIQFDKTICIFGNGEHFQPVELVFENNNGRINGYMIDASQFNGEEYEKNMAVAVDEKTCFYEDGAIVTITGSEELYPIYLGDEPIENESISKDKRYKVVGREYDVSTTPWTCNFVRLVLEDNEDSNPYYKVPVSDVEIFVEGGNKKRRTKKRVKSRKSRSRKTKKWLFF
jgi:hypothetical protein